MNNKKMEIPDYITVNCNNGKNNKLIVTYCEYFMHVDCPETCAYAKDIKGIKNIEKLCGE